MKIISGVFVFLCSLILGNSIASYLMNDIQNETLFVLIFVLSLLGWIINFYNFIRLSK